MSAVNDDQNTIVSNILNIEPWMVDEQELFMEKFDMEAVKKKKHLDVLKEQKKSVRRHKSATRFDTC